MTTFDLTALTDFAASLQTDQCIVTVDPEGTSDDGTLNTGDLSIPTSGPGDTTLVYTGPCQVSAVKSSVTAPSEQGGRELAPAMYDVYLPLDAPVPPYGATFTLTQSHDTALVDRPMFVHRSDGGTLAVRRHLLVEDRQTNPTAG